MIRYNYLLKYNWIFRYYLLIIFFLNLVLFYIFGIKRLFVTKLINNVDLLSDNVDLKLYLMLKKIIKIINNPIIFDYQIKQSEKINITSDKYIQYDKLLNHIQNNKSIKLQIYYKKAKKLLPCYYNHNEKKDILVKLLCINFQ